MPAVDDRPSTKSRKRRRLAPGTRRIRTSRFVRTTDRSLVKMALAGRDAAFEELVRRHQQRILNKTFGILLSREDAEDATQDTFVKAYATLATLRDPSAFASWLTRIAASTAIDRRRVRKGNASLDDVPDIGSECEGQAVEVEKAEDTARVLAALRNLREDYREIIELKYLHMLSYNEIAERLGMTTTSVGEKLCRVRKMLKRKVVR